ncbi:hypothetical protein ACWD4V_00425 [Streptomyces tsukubensis]|uniref:hypothetical protein n=1 Tax=Streptomyces tsukubensis TaxID=83656 RepID=UPI00369C7288
MAARHRTDGGGDTEPTGTPGPSVHIGTVSHSALTFGAGSTASTVNHTAGAVVDDPVQRELLTAVRALRADLERLVATAGTGILDAELASAEDEITTSGAAGPVRLERLRGALATAGEWVGALGSGVAVAELVTALIGG